MLNKFLNKNQDNLFFVFRVLVGLIFLLHGWMKMSAIMDGKMALMSLMGLAAVIETVGGIMLIIGLFTQAVAFIAGIEMLFAYFMSHAGNGLSPLANKGEAAALFFASFLVLAGHGAKKWSVDNLMHKN